MGARRCPPADNKVVATYDQINPDPEIRERRTKVVSDLLLALWPRQRGCRPKVMPNVIVGEDFVREVAVSLIPDLLVEAANQGLVLTGRHRFSSYLATPPY